MRPVEVNGFEEEFVRAVVVVVALARLVWKTLLQPPPPPLASIVEETLIRVVAGLVCFCTRE